MLTLPPINDAKPRKGTALIVAMALVLMLASMATVLMNEIHMRSHHVEVDLEDIKAFEAAEAGVDAAIADINRAPLIHLTTSLFASSTPTLFTVDNLGKVSPKNGAGQLIYSPDGRPVKIHAPLYVSPTITTPHKPGCIGTDGWKKPTPASRNDDILPAVPPVNGYIPRPTWQTLASKDANGNQSIHDPHIVPQQLGDVAFFTYAIDWLSDGIDNDGMGRTDIHNTLSAAQLIEQGKINNPYVATNAPCANDGKDKNNDGLIDDTELDVGERNKYTIYSTGIHKGILENGATSEGRVVTIEIVVQAADFDAPVFDGSAFEFQFAPKQ